MLVTLLLALLAPTAFVQAESAAPTLAEARARIQALASAPANALKPFQPLAAPGEDTRPGKRRAVPAVRLSTPWKEDEVLWLQVPEHVWTHLASAPDERRPLFSGEDPRKLGDKWGAPPFPASESTAWHTRADGGLELASELAGGVRVSFQVLPGDRMFELRFGLDNRSGAALLGTWPQFCNVFTEFGTLDAQTPTSLHFRVDGALVDWSAFGQDLSWIEKVRDPAGGKLVRACYLLALVNGAHDDRYQPEALRSTDQMWLARTLDLPLLVKSSPDGKRHLVLYSPSGRNAMSNLLSPCAHVDPFLERVDCGEMRWGVLYGIFYEGELGALIEGLVAADHELRRPNGFECVSEPPEDGSAGGR